MSTPPGAVPASVLTPIHGQTAELANAARGLGGLGSNFADTRDHLDRIHAATFAEWEGSAGDLGRRAFKVAKGMADRSSHHLHTAGTILLTLSHKIAELKAVHAGTVGQIQQLQQALQTSPTSPEAPHQIKEIQRLRTKAEQAHADASHAHRVAQAGLKELTMQVPYSIPPYAGQFGPLEAAVLDSLVVHHHISAKNAELAARRLSKLSAKGSHKLHHLLSSATTDKQRGDLFKGIATGMSLAQLATIDKYVNPLAGANLNLHKQHRIDQGVDYSGSGPIGALGAGVVTEVINNSGWGGAYVQYRLTSGPYSGHYVFYAEGVTPLVHVGDVLQPGQPVVHLDTGMEMGFAAGPGHDQKSWARVFGGGYTEGQCTAAGDAFNNLLKSLGAPCGQTLNRPIVGQAPTPHTPL